MCKIENFITKHNLLHSNSTVVIGLSGGPDSVFLLHTLHVLQQKYNLILIAAHLNHEWRQEADAEEEMCRTLAQKLNITFVSTKISSLTTIKKKYKGSKEEYARNMRRSFLEQVARQHNAQHIALGHHAQDQQETFFIRLIRGSSLAGLTGMRPQNGMYIRPLLETNKQDILDWLHTHNITYAIDASNESTDYLRNRIRATVLPTLAQCDTRFDKNFAATLHRLQKENTLLDDIAQTTLQSLLVPINDTHALDIKQFAALNSTLHHRIIINWLIQAHVPFPTTQAFLDEIIRFLLNPNGGTHTIHEQWSIVKKQQKAYIVKK